MDMEISPTASIEELRKLAEEKKKELAKLRDQTKVVEKKLKEERKQKKRGIKVRIGGPIDIDLVEKIKDIAYWNKVTVTDLIEQGLEYVVTQYSDIKPREGDLKRGRRKEEVEDSTEQEEVTV